MKKVHGKNGNINIFLVQMEMATHIGFCFKYQYQLT